MGSVSVSMRCYVNKVVCIRCLYVGGVMFCLGFGP